MEYRGSLFGKVGGRYIPLDMTADDVDALRDSLKELYDLLEEHQPEWYLNGHYKRAKMALGINDDPELAIPVKSEVYPFDEFWNDYEKKVGDKGKLMKKWAKIPDKERVKIKEYLPRYKEAQPDKKYRKNPETFLNNKSWNDELIYSKPQKSIGTDYRQSVLDQLRTSIGSAAM